MCGSRRLPLCHRCLRSCGYGALINTLPDAMLNKREECFNVLSVLAKIKHLRQADGNALAFSFNHSARKNPDLEVFSPCPSAEWKRCEKVIVRQNFIRPA